MITVKMKNMILNKKNYLQVLFKENIEMSKVKKLIWTVKHCKA